ncbi:hypothetical protein EJ07DRAFT_94391 [Lizonia empirigonia]|nr:hypothetical protein EJ07DRAFT_94391 [Lizonia empirigonia]
MPSRERQTADHLVAAYNTMDVNTIIALRTPDCERVFLPSSLKLPPQSNEAFRANLLAFSAVFTSFAITVNDVIESVTDVSQKRIVMYVSVAGETPVGEYRNEYVWKMGFEEGGERIESWSEFVDVGVARDFYPHLKGEMLRRTKEGYGREEGERAGGGN